MYNKQATTQQHQGDLGVKPQYGEQQYSKQKAVDKYADAMQEIEIGTMEVLETQIHYLLNQYKQLLKDYNSETQIHYLLNQYKQLLKDYNSETQQLGATTPPDAKSDAYANRLHKGDVSAILSSSSAAYEKDMRRNALARGVQRYHSHSRRSYLPTAIETKKVTVNTGLNTNNSDGYSKHIDSQLVLSRSTSEQQKVQEFKITGNKLTTGIYHKVYSNNAATPAASSLPVPRPKQQKQEKKYEVKPQYEELSKQIHMQHAINQCYECMRAIKKSDSWTSLSTGNSNQASIPYTANQSVEIIGMLTQQLTLAEERTHRLYSKASKSSSFAFPLPAQYNLLKRVANERAKQGESSATKISKNRGWMLRENGGGNFTVNSSSTRVWRRR
ncbi:TMV resistance protein N-like [Dorcoceras hygrometricum]|uniref:TMV resistance protein N-like n=1 Tax=Dorcoceras hygrometricum TaxID=472368 RepID=A0A2Z7DD06_9LAMI|nr:TMV resistance protein N-like [Dorcoceras hygrometricum]